MNVTITGLQETMDTGFTRALSGRWECKWTLSTHSALTEQSPQSIHIHT